MNPGFLLFAAAFLPALPALGASFGAPGPGLGAAAAASGRPKECMSSSRRALAKGPSVWEAAREPNLARYCDLMARAQTELSSQPDAAKAAAIEAEQALPGHAAPQVVRARAELALGSLEAAAQAFEKARGIEPRSVEDPGTMHDLSRVLARTGKRDEALAVYRALVPRVDLLGTPDRRISVLIEAAHVSMAADAAGTATAPADVGKKSSRARLDEAAAYLREARQRPATQLTGDVLLSLALVLDRAGDREQADAALAEAQRSGDAARFRSATASRARSTTSPRRRTRWRSRRWPRRDRSRRGAEGLGGVPRGPRRQGRLGGGGEGAPRRGEEGRGHQGRRARAGDEAPRRR